MSFFSEARLAIRGLGKYRLSKSFEDFFVGGFDGRTNDVISISLRL